MSDSPPLRRSRRGEQHTFAAGDKVEVVRTSGIEIGTLLHKIDEGAGESPSSSGVTRWMVAFEGDSDDSADEEEVSEKYIGRLVDSSNESENGKRKEPSSLNTSKKSSENVARKRSKTGRFQSNPAATTRAAARKSASEQAPLEAKPRRGRPGRPKKLDEDETVVKVKMLTGTLYLYRGKNPRAEFIRVV